MNLRELSLISSLALVPALACSTTDAESRPHAVVAWDELREPLRVGGDLEVSLDVVPGGGDDDADLWRSGPCAITTALPRGYPRPTPPGAIEIKRYPPVRRAQIRGVMNPDLGMNVVFWPLLQHIKSREIAMTAPVEIDYSALDAQGTLDGSEWRMAFLYREPELGPTGSDGAVQVVDSESLLVVSLGLRGDYSMARADQAQRELREWIDRDGRFEIVGAPRALYYNGPERRPDDKWAEVQYPVRPKH